MNEIPWNEVPGTAWNAAIRGQRLRGATLGEEVGRGAALLVFLRHFG